MTCQLSQSLSDCKVNGARQEITMFFEGPSAGQGCESATFEVVSSSSAQTVYPQEQTALDVQAQGQLSVNPPECE